MHPPSSKCTSNELLDFDMLSDTLALLYDATNIPSQYVDNNEDVLCPLF